MKGSRKQTPPPAFVDWLNLENEDWQPAYPFDDPEVRKAVIVNLHREQSGLCLYCGRKLDLSRPDRFHIEHFRPQNQYPERQVDYDNLFLSCGQHEADGLPTRTCGAAKGGWFDEENHIEPVYPACAQRYKFTLNGAVEAASIDDQPAMKMLAVLNLNHPELCKAREQVLMLVDAGSLDQGDFHDMVSQCAESFAHIVFRRAGHTLPTYKPR